MLTAMNPEAVETIQTNLVEPNCTHCHPVVTEEGRKEDSKFI